MMEELKQKVNEVYNWTVEDGKPQPPKQDLPQAVKDRADYFWEMAEDGMTFMGAMECIFADEKPTEQQEFRSPPKSGTSVHYRTS